MLKIYNTLTRDKQDFIPIEPGKVRMYVCGMTVYDYCHLGHARVMVVFDMINRWLRADGFAVTYVRNITDIDDKIIKRAAENHETAALAHEVPDRGPGLGRKGAAVGQHQHVVVGAPQARGQGGGRVDRLDREAAARRPRRRTSPR